MALLAVYHLRSIPSFQSAHADVRLYDCLVGQRALWSYLTLALVTPFQITAELRIGRSDPGEPLDISLRLHGSEELTGAKEIERISGMLPAQFEWERGLPSGSPDQDLPVETDWHVARVVRRLEYVDLPAISSTLLNARKGGAPNLEAGWLAPGAPADVWLRRLPGRESHWAELEVTRFCLPMVGAMEDHRPRIRSFFEEFERIGVGLVSICAHPMDQEDYLRNQQLALNWKRFLDPFAGELASTGLASLPKLRSTFDRFGLPREHLYNASMRVACRNEGEAVGLASVLAATMGGTRAFDVITPTRALPAAAAADILVSDAYDIPGSWLPQEREQQRQVLLTDMAEKSVVQDDVDDELLDFILHLPHVYTGDEVEQMVRFPVADDEGLPGLNSRPMPPFSTPSLSFVPVTIDGRINDAPADSIRVGMVTRPGARMPEGGAGSFAQSAWHTIPLKDLTKHALIVGSTGSGKTRTTLFLIRELFRTATPFMVIEPVKTEYFDELKAFIPNLRRLRLEGSEDGTPADYLAFDPMRIPRGITVSRHISYIKSCFQAAFPMEEAMALIFENGLIEYYTSSAKRACGFHRAARGDPQRTFRVTPTGEGGAWDIFPSFATFQTFFIEEFIPGQFTGLSGASAGRAEEWAGIFRRRLKNLDGGPVGDCFRAADRLVTARAKAGKDLSAVYETLSPALAGPMIVELDGAPDAEQKALLMAFLLTYLFERRQADDFRARSVYGGKSPPASLKHVVVLEEAHRLLAASSAGATRKGDNAGDSARGKAVGLFVDMLAEIRAYGQGLVIVEQIPTKIVPEAVKNTNLKIMLRLTAKDDREYLGEAMNFTEQQMRFVTNLRIEPGRQINFVAFEEGVDQPLLLSLPVPSAAAQEDRSDWLYDEFFSAGGGDGDR